MKALAWASAATGVPVSDVLGQWSPADDVVARWRTLEIARVLLGMSREAMAAAIGRCPATMYKYRALAEGRAPERSRRTGAHGLTAFEGQTLRAFVALSGRGDMVTVGRVASASGATDHMHPDYARVKTGRALARLSAIGLIAWTPKRGRPFGSQTKRAA